MGKKVFVSYKYADSDVRPLSGKWSTTVRSYVDYFERGIDNWSSSIYKGEHDGEDLSQLSDDAIWGKLKNKIYDSTVTVLFISPGMRNFFEEDRDQWIPWEVAYSLREETRGGKTSQRNSLVCVVLPDRNGSYDYYRIRLFTIVKANIDNGYAEVVKWDDFQGRYQEYFDRAERRKAKTPEYTIVKTI